MFKLKSKLTNSKHFEQYCRSNKGEFTFKTFFSHSVKLEMTIAFKYVTIRWSASMIINYDFVFSSKKLNQFSVAHFGKHNGTGEMN